MEEIRGPGGWEIHAQRGVALTREGRLEEASACFRQALELRPDSAESHNDLGNVLRMQGRLDEAMACYRRALRLRPDAIELHNNLASGLAARGRPHEAMTYARQARELPPESPATFFTLGTTLLALRLFEEAEACYRHALEHRPDDPETLNNLGTAVWEQGRVEEAEASYREALRHRPDDPDTLNNLGNALWEQGRLEEAVSVYRRALGARPESPEMHMNLGVALSGLGMLDEALACIREAIGLRPDWPAAHQNLGMTLGRQGRIDEALGCYEEALRLQPDFAEARRNRAMAWLSRGAFERGWPEYEWRLRCKGRSETPFPQPTWEGDDLRGRTILLHAEQGFGDTLQFVRYAALVERRGGKVLLLCPDPLARLLARCSGVDGVLIGGSSLPAFDVHAPLMSLPAILGTTLDSVPAEVPYLFADVEAVARRRRDLDLVPGFKVGIAWQGNPRHQMDRNRSFPLALFSALAGVPGVRLISLQKGEGTGQLRELAGRFPVLELPADPDGAPEDFLETAAVMKNLDLVVTPDMSVAHLAGGLGVRTWVALPAVAEWRWLADREDSPWYPTIRLFRQARAGDWDEVFRRIARAVGDERGAG